MAFMHIGVLTPPGAAKKRTKDDDDDDDEPLSPTQIRPSQNAPSPNPRPVRRTRSQAAPPKPIREKKWRARTGDPWGDEDWPSQPPASPQRLRPPSPFIQPAPLPSPPSNEPVIYAQSYHGKVAENVSLPFLQQDVDEDIVRQVCETHDLKTMYNNIIVPILQHERGEFKWAAEWYYVLFGSSMEALNIIINNFVAGAYTPLVGISPLSTDELNRAFKRVVDRYAELAKRRGWNSYCHSIAIPVIQSGQPPFRVEWQLFEIEYDPTDPEHPGPFGGGE